MPRRAIDLFPRKPGATFDLPAQSAQDGTAAKPESPFAVLAKIKNKTLTAARKNLATAARAALAGRPKIWLCRGRNRLWSGVFRGYRERRGGPGRPRLRIARTRHKRACQRRAPYRSTPWAAITAPRSSCPARRISLVRHPDVSFLLFGDEARMRRSSTSIRRWPSASRIVHTDTVVEMQDKPSQAVRRGRGSSMWLALEAVQKGEADFAVSAGNTGALMAMAKLMLAPCPASSGPPSPGCGRR